MFVFLLGMTLAQADSAYESAGLRDAVARAAERNRQAPAGLHSYGARVESEAAMVIHTVDGQELTGQIEQIASRVEWRRGGAYAQHIIGHRIQAAGPNPSVISYLRRGWTMPVLYGERLGVFGVDIDEPGKRRGPTYQVVHPFSRERDRLYRFEDGDTVAVLRLPDRDVHVMRIRVSPRHVPADRILAFDGDIDLDAERHQIVRMRGRLVVFRPARGLGARLLGLAAQGFAYVDLENAEYEGRYWLPYRQRLELQATSAFTDSRAVIRVVSQFDEHRIGASDAGDAGDPGVAANAADAREADGAAEPSAAPTRPRFELTFAPGDTLGRYDAWVREAGEATAGLSAQDFDDVAPPALRPRGRPHVRPGARQLMDWLRYNRVEGVYTGAAGVLAFRDAAPGLELRGAAGWAWTQQVPRGNVELILRRDAWELGARAARDLALTNDFVPPLEQGLGILMLLGAGDDFDYVDRRSAVLSVARYVGGRDSRIRLELGGAQDRPEPRRLRRGPYGGDTLRLNRPASAGSYFLSRLTLEHRRSVNASSLRPGLGARLSIENAAGRLDWRRAEAGLYLRALRGPFTFSTRLDAGIVSGDAPPQALFELGTTSGLSGYEYKEFGGDRAALLRAVVLYDPPLLDTPIRIGSLVLPAISPAPVIQWHAGWAGATGRARPTLEALGSRETDGLRSTLSLQLAFFGGMFGLGIARPLERGQNWDFMLGIGGVL